VHPDLELHDRDPRHCFQTRPSQIYPSRLPYLANNMRELRAPHCIWVQRENDQRKSIVLGEQLVAKYLVRFDTFD
jgi:hypothetical protein